MAFGTGSPKMPQRKQASQNSHSHVIPPILNQGWACAQHRDNLACAGGPNAEHSREYWALASSWEIISKPSDILRMPWYVKGLGPRQIVYANNVIDGRRWTLGHPVSVWPLEVLEQSKVSHVGILRLYDWPWIKSLDTKARLASLVGDACTWCHPLLLGQFSVVCKTQLDEDSLKLAPGLAWTLPCVSFSFADLNLYPFTVINLTSEEGSFSKFSEYFWQIIKTEGGLEDPVHSL